MVASVSVKALTNSRDDGGVSAVDVVVVNALLKMLGFGRGDRLLYSAQKLPAPGVFC
jgi:hypothetical protein